MSIFNKLDFFFFCTGCLSDMSLCYFYLLCNLFLPYMPTFNQTSGWHRMHIKRSKYSWQMDAIDMRQQLLAQSHKQLLARLFERPFTKIVGQLLKWFAWETQSDESCFDCCVTFYVFVCWSNLITWCLLLMLAAAQGYSLYNVSAYVVTYLHTSLAVFVHK